VRSSTPRSASRVASRSRRSTERWVNVRVLSISGLRRDRVTMSVHPLRASSLSSTALPTRPLAPAIKTDGMLFSFPSEARRLFLSGTDREDPTERSLQDPPPPREIGQGPCRLSLAECPNDRFPRPPSGTTTRSHGLTGALRR